MASKPKTYKGTFVDVKGITLYHKKGDDKYSSRLLFAFLEGVPKLTVFLATPDKNANPRDYMLSVSLATDTLEMWISEMLAMATDESVSNVKYSIGTTYPEKDEKGNYTGVQKEGGKLHYGKDEAGYMWMGLEDGAKPKILFKFETKAWHTFTDTEGKPVTPAKSSCNNCKAKMEILRNVNYGIQANQALSKLPSEDGPHENAMPATTTEKKDFGVTPSNDSYDDDDITF